MARARCRIFSALGVLAAGVLSSALLAAPVGAVDQDPVSAKAPPIVGGQPTGIADSPFVAFLVDAQGNQFCGGTIARANKVITAAHCMTGETPSTLRVVSGREDKNSQAGTTVDVADIWVHPEFTEPGSGADVAVLTLAGEVPEPPLEPAGPQDRGLYQPGTQAQVYGWGATEEGGSQSDVLRRADVPLVSDEECGRAYSGSFTADAMVCAGVPQGGVDSCQGDSGGPLVAGDRLIGIVSFGNGCARPGEPGVYTEVARYHQDIQAQLT
ncbi:serine protease [Saccharopolyspora sp. HNM0983]|uniref:Serine protease n=1 Tax=Saccharopolyspora montiporae TaxID=2781240 RepID=A0A929B8R2_9PSEU|nr:serine protease [Saccharopolyspora sp. HNM0983]MBE9374341.1 serine protease [Saccharopolyspora sp. HNM0983]